MRPIGSGRTARLIYAGAVALVLALPATAVALTAAPISSQTVTPTAAQSSAPRAANAKHAKARRAAQRGCAKLFTVKMAERAAVRIYSGTRKVPKHALRLLGYIERCQRKLPMRRFVRAYDHRQARMHRERVSALAARRARAAQPSGWAIPSYIVMCESGGRNLPPNYAGASGYYQIIPSTWYAYGGGAFAPSAYQATRQQQYIVAARIWNSVGPSAWVCAGG